MNEKTFRRGDSLPAELNGIPLKPWVPSKDWHQHQDVAGFTDAPIKTKGGKKAASGAIVLEADDSVWIVDPANAFGGYKHTFPKGKVDAGLTLQQNARKEVWEEAGLQIEITGILGDFERDTSITRYYLARRIGGAPNEFETETEAVRLVPAVEIEQFLTHKNDQPVVKALKAHLAAKQVSTPKASPPKALWVFLSDSFLSIVADPQDHTRLKVRARFAGDIERVFPHATVEAWTGTDYAYRARIPRQEVVAAFATYVGDIAAENFKSSVKEGWRHDLYSKVWATMFAAQGTRKSTPGTPHRSLAN